MLPELLGIGALETEDRLLLVAHREQGARPRAVARALPGEEFLGELGDDPPLLRARVLRLVDQDMVQAAVELVEHPVRRIALLQERDGGQDQVVVVEHRALALHALIVVEHGERHRHHRFGHRRRDGGAPALFDQLHAREQILKTRRERRDSQSPGACRQNCFAAHWPW